MNEKALSGGDSRVAQDVKSTMGLTLSPPTQLREIAEKHYFWLERVIETDGARFDNLERAQVIEAFLRAMQEAWETGYKFGCDADNIQFKYGYKKGLADGDDTHALQ